MTSSSNNQQGEVLIQRRFQCPESFATQSLGIQNVPKSPAVTTIRQIQKVKTSPTIQCTSDNNNNDSNGSNSIQQQSIVRGLIYMPSSITASKTTPISDLDDDTSSSSATLFITVSTTKEPSAVIAGAQIPMSQIQDFPISFSLGRSNMLQKEDGAFKDDDLYVTAEVRSSSSSSSSSSGGVELLRGRGLARLLQLPTTDDETTMSIRAAASVRLSRSSSADVLYSW